MVAVQSKKERAAEFKRLGRQLARRKNIGRKLAIPDDKAAQRRIAEQAARDTYARIQALRHKLATLTRAHDEEHDVAIANAIAEQMYQVGKRIAELKRIEQSQR